MSISSFPNSIFVAFLQHAFVDKTAGCSSVGLFVDLLFYSVGLFLFLNHTRLFVIMAQ
jgi:hypothetical protein